jgi:hypothetical protein
MQKNLVFAIIFILVAIIISILLLNYYQINMNINKKDYNNLKLNRAVIFEDSLNNYY